MTAQSPNRTGLFGPVVTCRLTPTVEFAGRLTGPVHLLRASLIAIAGSIVPLPLTMTVGAADLEDQLAGTVCHLLSLPKHSSLPHGVDAMPNSRQMLQRYLRRNSQYTRCGPARESPSSPDGDGGPWRHVSAAVHNPEPSVSSNHYSAGPWPAPATIAPSSVHEPLASHSAETSEGGILRTVSVSCVRPRQLRWHALSGRGRHLQRGVSRMEPKSTSEVLKSRRSGTWASSSSNQKFHRHHRHPAAAAAATPVQDSPTPARSFSFPGQPPFPARGSCVRPQSNPFPIASSCGGLDRGASVPCCLFGNPVKHPAGRRMGL